MKEQKLVSMIDFVLTIEPQGKNGLDRLVDYKEKTINYANFLNTTLELCHFIYVGEDGETLEKPKKYDEWLSEYNKGFEHDYDKAVMREYQEAESKILFKGFYIQKTFWADDTTQYLVTNGEITIFSKHEPYRPNYQIDFPATFETVRDLTSLGVMLTNNAIKHYKI